MSGNEMARGTFCILLMAAFAATLGLGVISPFLPEFAERHGVNGFWIGMIFAGFAVSRGIVMPFIGRMSDRVGRKVFVTCGLFLFAVISLFYPAARNAYQLTAVRMVHGLAAGMIMPIVMAYVGDVATEGREGTITGAITMMFYLGLAAGPFLGGLLSHYYGFGAVFYAMAALGGAAFLITLLFLPESRKENTADIGEVIPLNILMKHNFVRAVLIIAAIVTVITTVFISFVPSLASRIHLDPRHTGIVISTGIFFGGILQIPSGRFADRLSRTGKLFQVSVGTSVGMLAIFVMPLCPDFYALMAAGALVGVGAAISTPALMGLSITIGHKAGMGLWMGIFSAATSTGIVLAPIVAGIIMDHLGIDMVFTVSGCIILFGTLLYGHFVGRRLLAHK